MNAPVIAITGIERTPISNICGNSSRMFLARNPLPIFFQARLFAVVFAEAILAPEQFDDRLVSRQGLLDDDIGWQVDGRLFLAADRDRFLDDDGVHAEVVDPVLRAGPDHEDGLAHRQPGRGSDLETGRADRDVGVGDLPAAGRPPVPQDLQDGQLGVGDVLRRARHDRAPRRND